MRDDVVDTNCGRIYSITYIVNRPLMENVSRKRCYKVSEDPVIL